MESKIRIKLGPVEVEYEGSESFLKQELPDLIKTITELYKSTAVNMGSLDKSNGEKKDLTGKLQLSTNSICARLSCSSGPDLIIAAAAHLTFDKQQDVFSRKQLLDQMKSASNYFKPTYRDNLTASLKTLLKDKLNEPSSGKYALTAKAREELEAKLVDRN
jgi:hypothetical protein